MFTIPGVDGVSEQARVISTKDRTIQKYFFRKPNLFDETQRSQRDVSMTEAVIMKDIWNCLVIFGTILCLLIKFTATTDIYNTHPSARS